MTDLSRRKFLGGAAACAAAAVIPVPLAEAFPEPEIYIRYIDPPLFSGSIGVYQGVIFRQVADLAASCSPRVRPIGLREFYRMGDDE